MGKVQHASQLVPMGLSASHGTDSVARLQKGGAGSAPSIGELAAQVDTIITMLPSSPHVMDVYNKEVQSPPD